MPRLIERARQTFVADPHHVRPDVVVVGEDQPRSYERHSRPAPVVPILEITKQLSADKLVLGARQLGHVEISLDDLVALAVVRQEREISGSELPRGFHFGFLSTAGGPCPHSNAKRARWERRRK